MKKAILFFLFLFISEFNFAQDELVNLQKYWHYRYRLTHYYMVVGEGPGMSLPADIRNTNNSGEIRWGEVPVYLGYYIGTLATEYRLLKDNNYNTDQTLTELYYALKAAIRIDNVAENQDPWNHDPSTNGFLIRDDVPDDFLLLHSGFLNQNIPQNQGITIGSGKPGIVTSMHSDYTGNLHSNPYHPENNAISQDVVYQLLMGFALVKRYVDPGVISFDDLINNDMVNIDLQGMAIDEADLIVSYIKANHSQHWEINDPDGHDINAGGNCASFAFAIARAGNYITGNDYTDFFENFDEPFWQTLQDPEHLLCHAIGDQASAHPMALVLAAMSNSWKEDHNQTNTTPDQILLNGDYESSITPCNHPDNHYGWDVFYGALWDVFHGGPRYISDLCKVRDILNSAPFDGPFYHDITDNASAGSWCATRRFFDDAPRQQSGKPGFNGNFNGLDYMLLFNLYYLDSKEQRNATQQSSAYYVPNNNPFVSGDYPYPSPTFLNVLHITTSDIINAPFQPVIVNSLSITNNSGPTAGVGALTIHGGPQGTLLTNTNVEYGAYLYIAADCFAPQSNYYFDPTSYHFRMISPNSVSGSNNAIEEVNLFPNPSSSSITITFPPLQISGTTIQIFNSEGKIVFEKESNSEQNVVVDISEFASGIYFVKIDDGEKAYTKKFIRQ
jgi:hypothetical protein